MAGRILVGTSSWTDKSLIESGAFYPPECTTPEARLRYYASQFPVVQNDAAWYALPARPIVKGWVDRTPADFVFDVKLFRLFTRHQTPLSALPADLRSALPSEAISKEVVYLGDVPETVRDELWRRYTHALEPLRASNKLGVVMIQLAPWVQPGMESQAHLRYVRERLAEWPLAVEFRNGAWYAGSARERTYALLRDQQMAHVVVDEPPGVENSVPLVPAVTWPRIAILRLHGRNRETWAQKGLAASSERFNYEYSQDELREFIPVVRQLADAAGEVHVMFNTNYQDQGQRAARQ
ncbi:MAG: DUF72 domain-containing protein, partial [Chloroflexi bacterium]|nr:DUF72 domain-containing protein [Chloroflexota bacterium]